MAEEKTRPQMMEEAKQKTMQLATQGSQTKQLFAQAQQKSPQDFNQLVDALNDSSKTMEQLEDQIKKLANKMASQGKISKQTAAAVNIQMDDKQLREKIAQFSQFDIKANIQGSPKDIDKIQKSLSSLIKQAKKGNKDAQALLKSLSSADFKQLKNADKILKNLSDEAQQAGVSLQQLNKNTLKGCTIFSSFNNKAKETSESVEQYSDMLYKAADKMKLTSDSTRGLVTGLAGIGGVTMAAIKGLNDLHESFQKGITSIIQFKRNSQFASAANSDILPGGVQQLEEIRTSMNLTREQTVQFAQGLSKLRGTTYDVNDLTAAMQGMKDTIGKIDTAQLQKLTGLMQKVPKQQLDAITKGTGSSQDAAAGVLNIVNSGQQQAFLQAGASGAFGKQYAQNMGVKIDQNDRQYTQNTAMVQRVTQSVQNLSHNATNFFTKALPLIGGVMVANKMLGKVAAGGGMVKGLIGGIKGLFGKGKGDTGKSGLGGVIDTVKNAVTGAGKNMAQSNNGQDTQTVAVGVQGKLDKIISLLQQMVGQNNSNTEDKNQDNTEDKNDSTDNTINNAVDRITKTVEKAPGRNFKAGALKFGRNFSKKATSLGKSLGGKIGGKYGKIVADVFSKIGAKGLNLSKWVGNLGTKILPHMGKVLGVVGIAAGMAIQGFKGFKQGLQDAEDAAKFFGHENKGTSTGQDIQNVVTGITGGNMVQGFIDMFRDKDQVQKERIVNAQAGVSNTAFGTNTAGGALIGAGIGLTIGGPVGAAVGAAIGAGIGLLVDATNQIQKAIKADQIAAIQKTYETMKAAKEQQEKNAREHQVMMQHSVKMASQNKKILQAINEGQFSILETTKANQALFKNKKQSQLVSGITSQQYSQNNKIAVQQSGAAFSKDVKKLQQQRTKIQNDPSIQGQVKLKLLNDIMQQQIKMRQKYNQQLLQATDLNNIPKVIQNQLTKRINTASADMGSTGMYGSSQGIIDDLGGNIEATMSTLFAQTNKMGQNSQHFKKMKQDQQKRVQQARDTSFAAAFGGINNDAVKKDNVDQANAILGDIQSQGYGGKFTGFTTGKLNSVEIQEMLTGKKHGNTAQQELALVAGSAAVPVGLAARGVYQTFTNPGVEDNKKQFADVMKAATEGIQSGDFAKASQNLIKIQSTLQAIGTAQSKAQATRVKNLRQQLQAQNQAAAALGNFASNVKEFQQGTDISQTSLGKKTRNSAQLQQRKQFLQKAEKAGLVQKTKDKDGKQTYKVKDAKGFQQLYKKQSIKALYSNTANMALKEKGSVFEKDALDEKGNIKKQYQSFLQKDQHGRTRVKKNLNEQQQKDLKAFISKNKDAYVAANGQKSMQKLFGKQGSIKYKDSTGKEQTVTKDAFKKSLKQTQQLLLKNKSLDKNSDDYKLNQAKIKQNQQLQYNVLMNQKNVTIDKAALKKAKDDRDQLGYGTYQDYKKKQQAAGKSVIDKKTWQSQKIARQNAYNQTLKGQMNKVNMQSGGAGAGLAAIDNIQAANRQMATSIVANAKNMQDLSKTFTELDQNIGKLIGAIKNDPNVRRKLMQAQLKGLQKQLNAWNGKTDANGNPTVGMDNIAAYNAEMDALDQQQSVANKVSQQLERLSSITTQGGADAIKSAAASFKDGNLKDINVVKKNEKGQMVDDKGKVVTDVSKAKKQSFTDSIFDIASKAAGSKDDKTISGALDTIQKQYKEAEKEAAKKAGVTLDANGKAKGSDENVKKYNQMIAQLKAAKTTATALVKSGGSLKTANQQLKIQMLKIQQQRVQKFKQFVDVMSKSIQTQKMFMASIQRAAAQKQNNLAIMQHGSSQQLVKHMNDAIAANNKYYKDSLKQNKSNQKALQNQIKLLQTTGKDSSGKSYTGEALKNKIQQTKTALTAAQGQQAGIKAQQMKKNQQIVMTNIQGIQSRYSAKKENIQIQQDYAQNVSGTTQQWMRLQNQKLNMMKQQVGMLQQQLKNADKLGLSQQAKLQIKNKLMKKSVDLQKERIGAQRNVFEKMLGSLLGGLQQQGAFKGFNQASVFGVGHGINQAGMAVAEKKKVKLADGTQVQVGGGANSYAARLAAANAPTDLMGSKGSANGIADAVNNTGTGKNVGAKTGAANVSTETSNNAESSNSSNPSSTNANNTMPSRTQQNNATAQDKKTPQKTQEAKNKEKQQTQNANLKDHDIFAKQLTVLQNIYQIMKNGRVANTNGVQSSKQTKDNSSKSKDEPSGAKKPQVEGGKSQEISLKTNKALQKEYFTQQKKQSEKNIEALTQQQGALAIAGVDRTGKKYTGEALQKRKQQIQAALDKEKAKKAEAQNALKMLNPTIQPKEQQTQPQVNNVQSKPQRVYKEQFEQAQGDLKRKNRQGFWRNAGTAALAVGGAAVALTAPVITGGLVGGAMIGTAMGRSEQDDNQTKFSKRRLQLIAKKQQLDEKIKNSGSIQQRKQLQAEKDKVMAQYKQVGKDQSAARSTVQQYKNQQVSDKKEYQLAKNNLEKHGSFLGIGGKTQFEMARQALNKQYGETQEKIKRARTPQQKAFLEKRLANIEKLNEKNNADEQRAKEVVKTYEKDKNLDAMYRKQQQQKKKKQQQQQQKKQGGVSVNRSVNNNSGANGNIRRIPFQDMSSDNSRGKINGYIQVQVIRRVVINSSDQSLMKQMSPLQGSGSTS